MLALTGCGVTLEEIAAPSPAQSVGAAGKLHGGPNPIQQASITLWETYTYGIAGTSTGRPALSSNSGYGSAAYRIGSTTTDSNGAWSVASFNCDAGEYVYVTATGGKTASNAAQPNEVLVAPLGACSSLPASVKVDISETSTLAMAYTLGRFASDSTTGANDGAQKIYLGAPAANNASAGSCTNPATSCVASGLGQGFADAIRLVQAVSYTSAKPSGQVNTVPTNADGSVPNATGLIPVALLNTLANVLQSCVNTGGSAVAGDGSACGKLFTATTVGSSVPTDTWLAAVSMAQNPTNNVDTIYKLATPVSAFTPALTAEPASFALAVRYTAASAGANAVQYTNGLGLALTPDDKVIYAAGTANATTATGGLLTLGLDGSYNGGAISSSIASSTRTSIYATPAQLVVTDNAGQAYFQNSAGTYRYQTTGYSLSAPLSNAASAAGLAVDRHNYVCVGVGNSVSCAVDSSSSFSPVTFSSFGRTNFYGITTALAIDAASNLWAAGGGFIVDAPGCALPGICPRAYQDGYAYGAGGSIVIASDGAGWIVLVAPSSVYTTTKSRLASTPPSYSVFLTGAPDSTAGGATIDGGNVIFIGTSVGSLVQFSTATQVSTILNPCFLSAGSTVCTSLLSNSNQPQVDAAGAVWIADATGDLVKIYGLAVPAWPYLGYGVTGVAPQ